jgi:hypothetical protein
MDFAGGLLLVYSSWLYDAFGLGLIALVIILQKTRAKLVTPDTN